MSCERKSGGKIEVIEEKAIDIGASKISEAKSGECGEE